MYNWIKLIIAWPISWILDYLGNFLGDLSTLFDSHGWQVFWYRVYNPILLAGSYVQDWAGGIHPYFPWNKITMDEETIARLKQEDEEDEKHQPAD
jgi:hypothetical protein